MRTAARVVACAIAIAATVVCAPASAVASAGAPRRAAAVAPALLAPKLAAALDLTRAQKARIDNVALRAHKRLARLRQRIDTNQSLLRSELASQDPHEARVAELIRRVGALETEARKVRVFAWLDVRKILTVPQRRRLRALYAARRRGRHRRH